MYGTGLLKGLGVTFKHFIDTYIDDFKWGILQGYKRYTTDEGFEHSQSPETRGIITIQYPEVKMAVPERFRFIPFLVVNDADHPEEPGAHWCTSCGICSKVCPPQCIWIVRTTDPETGRPVPEPEQFYIDIDICMNCGYCAEFCPFDAIKMDHDYELSSYDRTAAHIYDKAKLSKPLSYWQTIAPSRAEAERLVREAKEAEKAARKSRGKKK